MGSRFRGLAARPRKVPTPALQSWASSEQANEMIGDNPDEGPEPPWTNFNLKLKSEHKLPSVYATLRCVAKSLKFPTCLHLFGRKYSHGQIARNLIIIIDSSLSFFHLSEVVFYFCVWDLEEDVEGACAL